MDLKTLAQALERMGCPPEKSAEMAAQLDRRAAQLAAQTGRSQAEALAHLLALMQQGWAAQSQGSPPARS
ncbi:hypothetical protein NXS98_00985 [Fontisphaera persica]|uniref:hypothetical protein n=1 Tax=Fontisphaera persica TaxID=2974023 RepID=UPI0024BFA9F8|nr:hypothetical protein [Fontisphaera persica]WCJ59720.1 hypothetical protein NXS98_00985 [Fontisphaera persica]